jgi:hypothetical protein
MSATYGIESEAVCVRQSWESDAMGIGTLRVKRSMRHENMPTYRLKVLPHPIHAVPA